MALPLLHAGTGAGGVPNVGALKWSSGGAFVWSDDDYIVPSLDLNFALFKDLRPRIGPTPTFTRASTGTYFNSSGVLTTAAINGPRFDHVYNGSSWVSKGLLIEEARTNLLTYSNDWSNAAWAKVRGTVAKDVTGLDGTTSGWTATCNSTGGGHYAGLTPASGASASGAYTLSVYAKAGNNGFVSLQITDAAGSNYAVCFYNLSTGSAAAPAVVGTYSAASASMIPCGGGWYRCVLTSTKGSTNGITAYISYTNDSISNGNCTSGQFNYVYESQLEVGAFATSTIPTVATQVTRSADVCQITGGDFSSFWNASEGSFVVNWDFIKTAGGAPFTGAGLSAVGHSAAHDDGRSS